MISNNKLYQTLSKEAQKVVEYIYLSFASNDFLRQRHKKTTWILA